MRYLLDILARQNGVPVNSFFELTGLIFYLGPQILGQLANQAKPEQVSQYNIRVFVFFFRKVAGKTQIVRIQTQPNKTPLDKNLMSYQRQQQQTHAQNPRSRPNRRGGAALGGTSHSSSLPLDESSGGGWNNSNNDQASTSAAAQGVPTSARKDYNNSGFGGVGRGSTHKQHQEDVLPNKNIANNSTTDLPLMGRGSESKRGGRGAGGGNATGLPAMGSAANASGQTRSKQEEASQQQANANSGSSSKMLGDNPFEFMEGKGGRPPKTDAVEAEKTSTTKKFGDLPSAGQMRIYQKSDASGSFYGLKRGGSSQGSGGTGFESRKNGRGRIGYKQAFDYRGGRDFDNNHRQSQNSGIGANASSGAGAPGQQHSNNNVNNNARGHENSTNNTIYNSTSGDLYESRDNYSSAVQRGGRGGRNGGHEQGYDDPYFGSQQASQFGEGRGRGRGFSSGGMLDTTRGGHHYHPGAQQQYPASHHNHPQSQNSHQSAMSNNANQSGYNQGGGYADSANTPENNGSYSRRGGKRQTPQFVAQQEVVEKVKDPAKQKLEDEWADFECKKKQEEGYGEPIDNLYQLRVAQSKKAMDFMATYPNFTPPVFYQGPKFNFTKDLSNQNAAPKHVSRLQEAEARKAFDYVQESFMFGDKEDLLVEHEEPAIALKSFKSTEPIENHFPPMVVKDHQHATNNAAPNSNQQMQGVGSANHPAKLNKAASMMQESEQFFKSPQIVAASRQNHPQRESDKDKGKWGLEENTPSVGLTHQNNLHQTETNENLSDLMSVSQASVHPRSRKELDRQELKLHESCFDASRERTMGNRFWKQGKGLEEHKALEMAAKERRKAAKQAKKAKNPNKSSSIREQDEEESSFDEDDEEETEYGVEIQGTPGADNSRDGTKRRGSGVKIRVPSELMHQSVAKGGHKEIHEGTVRIVGGRNSRIAKVIVSHSGQEVLVEGRQNLNCALDGDIVRIEILKQKKDKKLGEVAKQTKIQKQDEAPAYEISEDATPDNKDEETKQEEEEESGAVSKQMISTGGSQQRTNDQQDEAEEQDLENSEDLDQESSVSEPEDVTESNERDEEENQAQQLLQKRSMQENPEMSEAILRGKIIQILMSPKRKHEYVVTLKITQAKLLDIRILNRLQKIYLKQMQALEEGTEDQVQVPREKGRRGIPQDGVYAMPLSKYIPPLNLCNIPEELIKDLKHKRAYQNRYYRVRILSQTFKERRRPSCQVISMIGQAGDFNAEFDRILLQTQLPQIQTESKNWSTQIDPDDVPRRKDLRSILTYAFKEQETSQMAFSVVKIENEQNCFDIQIHVADVDHYVPEDSRMDRVCRQQTQASQIIHKKIPLVPQGLEKNQISFQQNHDRMAVSTIAKVRINNGTGQVEIIKGPLFCESVIRIHSEITYDKVQSVLEGPQATTFSEKNLSQCLTTIEKVMKSRRTKRVQGKDPDFIRKLTKFRIDLEKGEVLSMSSQQNSRANLLIQESQMFFNEGAKKKLSIEKINHAERPLSDSVKIFLQKSGLSSTIDCSSVQSIERSLRNLQKAGEFVKFQVAKQKLEPFLTSQERQFKPDFSLPLNRYSNLLVQRHLKDALELQQTEFFDPQSLNNYKNVRSRLQLAENLSLSLLKKSYLASRGPLADEGIICDLTPDKVSIFLPKLDLISKVDLTIGKSKFVSRKFDEQKLSLTLSEGGPVLKVCGRVKVKAELSMEDIFKEQPVCSLLISADEIEEFKELLAREKTGIGEIEKQEQINKEVVAPEESNVKSIYYEEDEIFGREF